jgi:hypothetical protein
MVKEKQNLKSYQLMNNVKNPNYEPIAAWVPTSEDATNYNTKLNNCRRNLIMVFCYDQLSILAYC